MVWKFALKQFLFIKSGILIAKNTEKNIARKNIIFENHLSLLVYKKNIYSRILICVLVFNSLY